MYEVTTYFIIYKFRTLRKVKRKFLGEARRDQLHRDAEEFSN